MSATGPEPSAERRPIGPNGQPTSVEHRLSLDLETLSLNDLGILLATVQSDRKWGSVQVAWTDGSTGVISPEGQDSWEYTIDRIAEVEKLSLITAYAAYSDDSTLWIHIGRNGFQQMYSSAKFENSGAQRRLYTIRNNKLRNGAVVDTRRLDRVNGFYRVTAVPLTLFVVSDVLLIFQLFNPLSGHTPAFWMTLGMAVASYAWFQIRMLRRKKRLSVPELDAVVLNYPTLPAKKPWGLTQLAELAAIVGGVAAVLTVILMLVVPS